MARLAAVQALYQMETAGAGSEAVIREFGEHRFDRDVEGERLAPADEAYLRHLVRGVVEQQARLDKAIRQRLADGWRLERLDATLRAILRAGAFELIGRRRAGRGGDRRVRRDRQVLLRRAGSRASSTPPWMGSRAMSAPPDEFEWIARVLRTACEERAGSP